MCKFIPGSGTQQSRFDTCFLEPSSGGARFCGQHKLPKRDDEQQTLRLNQSLHYMMDYMGGCQSYGPVLGPYYNTAPNI